jgi:hypothetical protein
MSNALELARDALYDFVGRDFAHLEPKEALAAWYEAIKKQGGQAKARFEEHGGPEIIDPVERLRFFCSLAMTGQDWIDVEPFFDALKTQGAPVAYRITSPDGIVWIGGNPTILPRHTSEPLFTQAPTIPDGYSIVSNVIVLGLATWMDEAADDIADWGAYASKHFQEKHQLANLIADYKTRAQKLRDTLAAPECKP